MKKVVWALALASVFTLAMPASARADEKMLGVVAKLDVSGSTAVATLKDSRSGALVEITVTDDVTLAKLKDHRISLGDEIKCKYEQKDGKNVATYFKKAAGC
jgi:hypothetical protein